MAAGNCEMSEEAFSSKMLDTLNCSALSMGIAIGDYVGLFEAMSKLEEPKTSFEIAAKAGLNER